MVTLEQKLSLFKKLVDEKVQKEINERISNKDDEIKEFLDKEKQILEKQGLRVMFKPFDLFELLRLVETVLDESSKKPEVAAKQPE